ncbi:MAG: SDR family NAD(P)-dependent oxidoreductase, partial [Parvibaculaceae bacterium]
MFELTALGRRQATQGVESSLEGKRALVTGAASGIGKAATDALSAAGAEVVGLDRDVPTGFRHACVRADLTEETQINDAVGAALRKLGGLDILVNNAGIMRLGLLRDVAASDIDLQFAVNTRAPILVTREA